MLVANPIGNIVIKHSTLGGLRKQQTEYIGFRHLGSVVSESGFIHIGLQKLLCNEVVETEDRPFQFAPEPFNGVGAGTLLIFANLLFNFFHGDEALRPNILINIINFNDGCIRGLFLISLRYKWRC